MRRGPSPIDLWNESIAGLAARPGRTLLTLLSVTIGVAALVAIVGISRTAGNQILDVFDAAEATQISVETRTAVADDPFLGPALEWGTESRTTRLNGVIAAGSLAPVDTEGALISSSRLADPTRPGGLAYEVTAVSSGLSDAVDARMSHGRFISTADIEKQRRVAVLGQDIATDLNIARVENRPAIYIGDDLYTVIGILSTAPRRPTLVRSILIPSSTAQEQFATHHPAVVVIQVQLGAAELIAKQGPMALSPNDPTRLQVIAPPNLAELKAGLETNINMMFVALGLLAVGIGALGIFNTTLVSVLERRSEIGLRRSLGARRHHIAIQILTETGLIGLSAGTIGATAGILTTIAVAASNNWTPILDVQLAALAPLGATLVAVTAGLSPAIRAARIQPADALRA